MLEKYWDGFYVSMGSRVGLGYLLLCGNDCQGNLHSSLNQRLLTPQVEVARGNHTVDVQ